MNHWADAAMNSSHLRDTLRAAPWLFRAAKGLNEWRHWLQWRLSPPAYPAGELRLNLGCGDIDQPGFVNIDARPQKHVHRVQRIDRLPAFADDSAAMIYTSHCLEHVPHGLVPAVLREWRRVLRPGGILRVSVPDFDLLVNIYLDNERDMQSMLLPLMGAQDYAFNFHYSAFNRAEMSRLMLEAGLRTPRTWEYGADAYSSLPDWSGRCITYKGKEYPVSLNLEAVK